MEKKPASPPPGLPLQVELSEPQAEGIYSNLVLIAHSNSEFILDFARTLPGLPKAKIYARVLMTPHHAKALLVALQQNVQQFESQYGAVKLLGENRGKDIGF